MSQPEREPDILWLSWYLVLTPNACRHLLMSSRGDCLAAVRRFRLAEADMRNVHDPKDTASTCGISMGRRVG